mmetsp:Transcript_28328/g.71132  ORF Transcript_28328/g.71132 Transcript_28328/m.71132 type:complete len:86 (-) Transcript_28328:959-1216(-)
MVALCWGRAALAYIVEVPRPNVAKPSCIDVQVIISQPGIVNAGLRSLVAGWAIMAIEHSIVAVLWFVISGLRSSVASTASRHSCV